MYNRSAKLLVSVGCFFVLGNVLFCGLDPKIARGACVGKKHKTWVKQVPVAGMLGHRSRTREMVPFGPIWSHMAPDGPIRPAPYGLVWSHLAPDGPRRPQMVPYGFIWSHMTSYGPIWFKMVSLGPIWPQMVPLGSPHMASYGPIWPQMGPGGLRWPTHRL